MFDRNMLNGFINLGEDQEFDFIRRLAQSKGDNLFKNAIIKPKSLIHGLQNQFDALPVLVNESTDNCFCINLPPSSQENSYETEIENFVSVRHTILEYIKNASKIFVYKCNDGILLEDFLEISNILSKYNENNIILYVTRSSKKEFHGKVKSLSKNIYIGYIDCFGSYDQSSNISTIKWIEIINRTFKFISNEAKRRIFGSYTMPENNIIDFDYSNLQSLSSIIENFDTAANANDYQLAHFIISEALSEYASEVSIWSRAAQIDMWSGRWQEAAAKYAVIRHFFPDELEAYLWGSKVFYMIGQSESAKILYENNIHRFDQNSESTWSVGCEIYFACADWKKLEAHAQVLVNNFPYVPWARMWLARAQINLDLIEEAITSIENIKITDSLSYNNISTMALEVILRYIRENDNFDRINNLLDIIITSYKEMIDLDEVPYVVGMLHSLNYREPHNFTKVYEILKSRAEYLQENIVNTSFVCLCMGLGSAVVSKDLILHKLIFKKTEFIQHIFSSADHHLRNVSVLLDFLNEEETKKVFAAASSDIRSRWTLIASAVDPSNIERYSILRKEEDLRYSKYKISHSKSINIGVQHPKIAVCISGQLRGFRYALPTWFDAGIDPRNSNITFFVHAWRKLGAKKPYYVTSLRSFPDEFGKAFYSVGQVLGQNALEERYPNLFAAFAVNETVSVEEVQDLYKTNHVVLEDDADDDFIDKTNAYKMYYKAESAWKLSHKHYEKFDLTMRIRPDQIINQNSIFDFKNILNTSSEKRMIFTKTKIYLDSCIGAGMDDQFAIGCSDIMSIYSTAFSKTLFDCEAIRDYFDQKPRFIGHVNFCVALMASGFTAEILPKVDFGSFADPIQLSRNDISNLINIDVTSRKTDIYDDILINACSKE